MKRKTAQRLKGIRVVCPAEGCKRGVTVYSKTEYVTCTAHGLEMKPEKELK